MALEQVFELKEKMKYVGKDVLREDVVLKVRGKLRYIDDLRFDRVLYAKLLRSPVPHALVKKVDVSEALKVPGVVDIITPFDVPKRRFGRTFSPVPWKVPKDRMILEEKVRFVGDPVAAVAATSEYAAEEAVERIHVEYEELPAVFTIEDAIQPEAPQIHEEIEVGDQVVRIERNIGYVDRMELGNKDEAYARASKVYEDHYRTHIVHNAYIEKRAIIAVPTEAGGLEVWCTTQSTHGTRYWLSYALGLPLSKVRVHTWPLGGAFGGKYNLALHEPIAGFLALRTKRPVKLVMSRDEDFYNTGRHPASMDVKIAVTGDGELTAMEMRAYVQSGAYADHMLEIVSCIGGWFISDYRAHYKYYEGYGVYTNLPVFGAMRGFGNPQQNFAVESMMDEIAEDLGLDPIEFRIKNLPRVGDIYYGQGPTVITVIQSIGIEETLRKAAQRIGWYERERRWRRDGKLGAIGFAVGHHTSGTGGEISEEQDRQEGTGAMIKVNEDGTINLITAIVDSGGGEHQVLRKICAEEIGVRLEDVVVTPMPTDIAPFDMGTHASRGTFVGGLGVQEAARKAKKRILEEAAAILDEHPENLVIEEGEIYSKTNPSKRTTVAAAALRSKTKGRGLIIESSSLRPKAAPPSWAAYFVELEIDGETGLVEVKRVVAGLDIGTVVNPREAEGQVHGGVLMGLGYALWEEVKLENGRYLNNTFLDYLVARSTDLPRIETFFAETYEPRGPFGARSIGEVSTNPVASAVANAVARALGKRIKETPITSEKILKALGKL